VFIQMLVRVYAFDDIQVLEDTEYLPINSSIFKDVIVVRDDTVSKIEAHRLPKDKYMMVIAERPA